MQSADSFQRQYRDTIGSFATGVTVLLIEREGIVVGMTANGITSLSLEPTQLLVCPGKQTRFAGFLGSDIDFTVNILGDHQEPHSNFFASGPEATFAVGSIHDDPPFELLPWPEAGRAPRLSGCIASVGCKVHAVHEGGDHWIVVGDVTGLHRSESVRWPLLYFEGQYHFPSKMAGAHLRPDFNPYQ
jgi:flavin reductase (DIM6/NTAB) family NADH-FMN oxidoreductase RutF